jgi:hypothetical protein
MGQIILIHKFKIMTTLKKKGDKAKFSGLDQDGKNIN